MNRLLDNIEIRFSMVLTSIKDAFQCYVNEDMLADICIHTNRQGEVYTRKFNENHPTGQMNWKNVTITELYAFIAVLVASGRNHGRKLHLSEMWAENDLFKQPFFTAVMSRNRFKMIFRHLRFDDPTTRENRITETQDKLQAIRNTYDQFVKNCIDNYSPSENITVDERLATFRGKCPFRVYIKSKPGRYGIKIWVCSDSHTAYILNSQVYTGMMNNQREIKQGSRVVLDMVRPYFGSGRGVTTDNFFTSIPLAEELLKQQLTITGTLRANKREIPAEFAPNSVREEQSSIFGFSNDLTLVSYVPAKKKAVILLSSQFHSNDISCDEKAQRKPEIILHYNKTKGAVDTGDKMTREYTCVRSTRRWPFRIFMEIIDMAALNAYIIFTKKFPNWRCNDRSRRRIFLQNLAQELALPNVLNRKQNSNNFHKTVTTAIDLFLVNTHAAAAEKPDPARQIQHYTNRRCSFCARSRDRKTKISCSSCKKPICNVHREETKQFLCPDCKNNE